MALDVALLEAAELGAVGWRVYGWNGPWVSLGRFQRPVDALVDPEGVRWVARPTGGKAVLHGHDVTVGLAVPIAALGPNGSPDSGTETSLRIAWGRSSKADVCDLRGRPSVKRAYTALATPLIEAMRACGFPAELAANTRFAGRGNRVADCFAHVSPNDIVHEESGVKVCGCALRLTDRAVLLQASIPAGRPLVAPASVVRGAVDSPFYEWDAASFERAFARAMS